MKSIPFYKYQGTGNDFILIDNRKKLYQNLTTEEVEKLCDRRFGIGADGLILLEPSSKADFKMVYYNSDGNQSTMCGNGGRCIVAFAHFLGLFKQTCLFEAIDGMHQARFSEGIVHLKMIDVPKITKVENDFVLDTGSPHYVQYAEDLKNLPVFDKGKSIRYSESFKKEGINVNFAEVLEEDSLFVRTYERGVEDETFSCGTGVTASALTYMKEKASNHVNIQVLGGRLEVKADSKEDGFENIWLIGPAEQVFSGKIEL